MLSGQGDDFFDDWCRDMEALNDSSLNSTPVTKTRSPNTDTARRQAPRRSLFDGSRATSGNKRRQGVLSPATNRRTKYTRHQPWEETGTPPTQSQFAPNPPCSTLVSPLDSRLLQHLSLSPATNSSEKSSKSPHEKLASNRVMVDSEITEHADVLPTINGKVADVRSISAETMADVITGRLPVNGDITIVDCRYPYEYDGGHIRGAINLYSQEDLLQHFFPQEMSHQRPQIVIFHCEFSAERGPKMYRHLRQYDRRVNALQYPRLSYPHIYILDAGYRSFYPRHKTLCEPDGYTSMLHADHKQDLRKFRVKSKSWPVPESRRKNKLIARKTLRF